MIPLCNVKTKPKPRPGLLPVELDLPRKETVRVDFSGHRGQLGQLSKWSEARCPQGDVGLMLPGAAPITLAVVCSALCPSSPLTVDLVQPVQSLQDELSGTYGVHLVG